MTITAIDGFNAIRNGPAATTALQHNGVHPNSIVVMIEARDGSAHV